MAVVLWRGSKELHGLSKIEMAQTGSCNRTKEAESINIQKYAHWNKALCLLCARSEHSLCTTTKWPVPESNNLNALLFVGYPLLSYSRDVNKFCCFILHQCWKHIDSWQKIMCMIVLMHLCAFLMPWPCLAASLQLSYFKTLRAWFTCSWSMEYRTTTSAFGPFDRASITPSNEWSNCGTPTGNKFCVCKIFFFFFFNLMNIQAKLFFKETHTQAFHISQHVQYFCIKIIFI